jgi:hypothetical protein
MFKAQRISEASVMGIINIANLLHMTLPMSWALFQVLFIC